jgi:dipeptidyl aminopeptidase/acylaminoacyl peptidase
MPVPEESGNRERLYYEGGFMTLMTATDWAFWLLFWVGIAAISSIIIYWIAKRYEESS